MPSLETSSPRPLLLPDWTACFRSDDLDEVRAFIGTTDGRQTRVVRRGQPMGYAFYRLQGQSMNMGGSESAVSQVVRGLVHGPVLQLSLPAGSTFRVGRQVSRPTHPSSAVIVPPGWECTRSSPPGSMLAIEINPRLLHDELASRRPAEGAGLWQRQLAVLDLSARERAGLLSSASDLVRATQPGTDPRQVALAERRVVEWMAGLALTRPSHERPGELSLERVRDLEGWIDAHLGEPLSLGRLCQVAGVGARCLQKTFEYRRGLSPMRFVTERRLIEAHRRLEHASPDGSVTDIALELGFDHLGRFAQMYRQVIGELPSQTLARRLPDGQRGV